jgi:hypothetical protein
MLKGMTVWMTLALALAACGGTDEPGAEAILVTWETVVDGATYVTLIDDPEDITTIEAALEADGRAGIPNGRLQPGDGGVNLGHDWHVVEVELADMAIEVCDGTVSYLDDLGYDAFVSEHGDRFCPWDARVVAVAPAE